MRLKVSLPQLLNVQYLPACCFLCIFLLSERESIAQSDRTPTASWLLPGVSYQASPNLKLLGQYGVNDDQDINAVYLQGFIKAGKHITLNPAYLYLNFSGLNGLHSHEHTMMNAAIFAFSLNKIVIDDRNLIWNRFRNNAEDLHFYRNRLRVTWPLPWQAFPAKLYIFNEGFFFFNNGQWTRNRLAAGFTCDITRWFNADIFFLREHDKYSGKRNSLFVMGTIQLTHNK